MLLYKGIQSCHGIAHPDKRFVDGFLEKTGGQEKKRKGRQADQGQPPVGEEHK